jgi:hypothetical protein
MYTLDSLRLDDTNIREDREFHLCVFLSNGKAGSGGCGDHLGQDGQYPAQPGLRFGMVLEQLAPVSGEFAAGTEAAKGCFKVECVVAIVHRDGLFKLVSHSKYLSAWF